MAIYHLHLQNISRGKGKNAVSAAAYRRAEKLWDEREQCYWNYSRKTSVIHNELSIPQNSPDWVKQLLELQKITPQKAGQLLWNKVERHETRMNARLAKEIEFALPIELNQAQAIALARSFIEDNFSKLGMMADWSVHWEDHNPHVHVMLTTRELNEQGFAKKVRSWDTPAQLLQWRQQWSEYANFHLKLHQHHVRMDHRSYQDQGIDLIPTVHRGHASPNMQQQGIETRRMQKSANAKQQNLEKLANNPQPLLDKISAQYETFTHEELGQALNPYFDNPFSKSSCNKTRSVNELLQKLDVEQTSSLQLTSTFISNLLSKIEHHDSVFTERELAKALSSLTSYSDEFAALLIKLKNSPDLIALGPGDDGCERFTTHRMLKLEQNIQTLADNLQHKTHKVISLNKQQRVLTHYQQALKKQLTPEQLSAVQHLVTPSAISCVVGRAGTGKSFSLGAARAIWQSQGLNVQGIALSGIAADGLIKDAGIPSRTIESFRQAILHQQLTLTPKTVVVMDEAGMTDSVAMEFVLQQVHKAGSKLVLVGDPAQLQPVGPGAAFRALLERIGFVELQTVYRQKEQWQQEATVALSTGDVTTALTQYEQQGCLHLEKNETQMLIKLTSDWLALRTESNTPLNEILVIAHRNEDVAKLNQHLRRIRLQQNEIAEGFSVATTQGIIKLAKGERILFLKNDRTLGVNNGRFATIQSIKFTESGQVINFTVILDGTTKEATIDPKQYNAFTYGYAATVHKVQGMTVNHTLVYAGGKNWDRHLTYVAHSRHRQSCHLYSHQKNHSSVDILKQQLSRDAMKDSVLDFPLAFAERRGLEGKKLIEKITHHILHRLSQLKQYIFSYFDKEITVIGTSTQQTEQQERRHHAKTVAHYVDVHRTVTQCWKQLNQRLKILGLDKMSYEPKAFAQISMTSEYQHLQMTIMIRDKLAATILSSPHHFEKALSLHNVDLAKLETYAKQFACAERVKSYDEFHQQGNIVLRDKIAATLMKDIKSHYRTIKSLNLSMIEIKKHAFQHHQRLQKLLQPKQIRVKDYADKNLSEDKMVNMVTTSIAPIESTSAGSANALLLSESAKHTLEQYIEALEAYQTAFDERLLKLGQSDENQYQAKMNETLKNCEAKATAILNNSTVWQELQQKAIQTFKELNQFCGLATLKMQLQQAKLSGEAIYRLVQHVQRHGEIRKIQTQSMSHKY